ncbi:short-chain dehydrogenase/reductase SDR [Hyaloscypha finlandica]|nr:short-chain dehydrogenase/reductase SDR [Hyaloscypha finlandica]
MLSSRLLANKVVAITGCSSGIGRATALECARHGARIVLHHIGNTQSEGDIATLKSELDTIYTETNISSHYGKGQRYIAVGADTTDPGAGQSIVQAAVSAFGEVDALVHNAGICQFVDFHAVTREQLERHMAVNFAGPFHLTQAVTEQIIKQKSGGSIVTIASITATLGSSQLTHYSPTKAALLGMTYSCAVALGPHGIRFNAVSPGTTETAMNKKDLEAGGKRAMMESRVPLGRLGNQLTLRRQLFSSFQTCLDTFPGRI